jgi:hypothetical protein
MGWERGETEEIFLEVGEKKKRRTGQIRYKEKVNKKKMDKGNGIRKKKTQRGTQEKRCEREGRSKSTILERSGIKKKRRRILGLRKTIWDSESTRNMGWGTELEKNWKDATERVQMGRSRGKKRKKKGRAAGE